MQGFPPTDSSVSEAHLEFEDLVVNGPSGNGGGIINPLNEQASGNCVFVFLTIEECDVC